MIWGKENTTEQWTSPFSFKMYLENDKRSFKKYIFWFCDADDQEVSYDEFRFNRDILNKEKRNWKYVIDSTTSH